MTALRLARDEAAYLAAFLGRVVGWDDRAAVRVQARGALVGVYAPSPLDVLAFVAVPLAEPVDGEIDETVSAGRLRDIVGDVSRLPEISDVPLPDAITGNPGDQGCGPPGLALPGPTGCYPYRAPLPAPPRRSSRCGRR